MSPKVVAFNVRYFVRAAIGGVVPCPILSYPILSCPILSYPVLSYPVLSTGSNPAPVVLMTSSAGPVGGIMSLKVVAFNTVTSDTLSEPP
jgi:hypothetical protein